MWRGSIWCCSIGHFHTIQYGIQLENGSHSRGRIGLSNFDSAAVSRREEIDDIERERERESGERKRGELKEGDKGKNCGECQLEFWSSEKTVFLFRSFRSVVHDTIMTSRD